MSASLSQGAPRQLRVCIVTHEFTQTDGQGKVNSYLAAYLASRGHMVTLVSHRADSELLRQPNVSWKHLRIPRVLPSALLRNLVFAVRAATTLRAAEQRFDIVHLNGAITFARCDVNTCHFVHAAWLKSSETTWSSARGMRHMYQKIYGQINAALERSAFKSSRAVVAVSSSVRRDLELAVGVNAPSIRVIPNGVDTEQFRPRLLHEPNSLRLLIGARDQTFICLLVGGVVTCRKNLDVLLRSLGALESDVHVAVIGAFKGGSYPAMANALGVSERVHFLGERTDVPDLLRGADVVVVPAHYEPFGLVVLEAMASGVPLVAMATVGAADIARDAGAGLFMTHADSADELARAIARLRYDPQLCIQMGRAGRVVAELNTWRAMSNAYETLYDELIGARLGRANRADRGDSKKQEPTGVA